MANAKHLLATDTLFLSDIHLGTISCHAETLLEFLDSVHCRRVVLVGDIVDLWSIKAKRRGLCEPQLQVVKKLLAMAREGIEIIYVMGNHDAGFRKVLADYPFDYGITNIKLCNQYVHETGLGKRFIVVHGDQFDNQVRCSRVLSSIGDGIYSALLLINRWWNRRRSHRGEHYFSLANAVKSRSGRALRYIHDYQQAAAEFAARKQFDGIICGHIHVAAMLEINDVSYLNTGDWQDSCTAIVEHLNGELELLEVPSWLRCQQGVAFLPPRVA
ncbi:UDP-2,3-diacylglucosamine diphosphatase [Pseudidiomarina sediminum]|uniref:UDP-2,3-diacylglucosamine diphosphatase n=1 Tax=Pseudidiomarina sediminum TaxID=431675 RepID=UPI001C960183|nr:UDP-2,3-diacylglucosamine diphosphatase [Pseudidiomarina sediminum]MBY6064117.1 UDP-2,3-diacylglucosamine diphosphatase [Pseudidiomarina sediminum]